jgi:putative phage-type endonuclease
MRKNIQYTLYIFLAIFIIMFLFCISTKGFACNDVSAPTLLSTSLPNSPYLRSASTPPKMATGNSQCELLGAACNNGVQASEACRGLMSTFLSGFASNDNSSITSCESNTNQELVSSLEDVSATTSLSTSLSNSTDFRSASAACNNGVQASEACRGLRSTCLSESASYDNMIDENILLDLESDIYTEVDEYTKSNLLDYSSIHFLDKLKEHVTNIIIEATMHAGLCVDTFANRREITLLVQHVIDCYFHSAQIYPVRSYSPDMSVSDLIHPHSIAYIQHKIQELKSQPQPSQRTSEWYEMRHNCITASNIYKALGSPAQVNQLIYEKCLPLTSGVSAATAAPNTTSSTHWGVRYEPVTTAIYEAKYPGNRVNTEFGCIRHPQYSFIGASPDGIVVSGPRIGHMLEIKNTVSREISDVPIPSHWIQCQVQMETCGLDYCDYIQTHIQEVEPDIFYSDNLSEYKGIILYLISRNEGAANYKYIYMPLDFPEITPQIVQSWTNIQMSIYGEEYLLFETLHWVLKNISCVIIPRNRDWFQEALPKFKQLWDTVEYERIHGYEHRMPKKRETRSSRPNQALLVSLLDHDM